MKEMLKALGKVFLFTLVALPGFVLGSFMVAFSIPGEEGPLMLVWLFFAFLISPLPMFLCVLAVIFCFIPQTRSFSLKAAKLMAASPYVGLLLFYVTARLFHFF